MKTKVKPKVKSITPKLTKLRILRMKLHDERMNQARVFRSKLVN